MEEIYTMEDLARMFSRSTRTIWGWVHKGILPQGTRLTRKSRYWRQSEIEHLLLEKRADK